MGRKYSGLRQAIILISTIIFLHLLMPKNLKTNSQRAQISSSRDPPQFRNTFSHETINMHNAYITANYTGLISHVLQKQFRPLVSSSKVKLTIFVFAWKRSKSLNRLLNSIKSAKYIVGIPIDIEIIVDGNYSKNVDIITMKFKSLWNLGNVNVLKREARVGLEQVDVSSLVFEIFRPLFSLGCQLLHTIILFFLKTILSSLLYTIYILCGRFLRFSSQHLLYIHHIFLVPHYTHLV
jgi:hypothetical protein